MGFLAYLLPFVASSTRIAASPPVLIAHYWLEGLVPADRGSMGGLLLCSFTSFSFLPPFLHPSLFSAIHRF